MLVQDWDWETVCVLADSANREKVTFPMNTWKASRIRAVLGTREVKGNLEGLDLSEAERSVQLLTQISKNPGTLTSAATVTDCTTRNCSIGG